MSFMLDYAHFALRSGSVFSRYCARVSLHSRSRPQLTKRSHWSMFEFLVRDFLNIYYTDHMSDYLAGSRFVPCPPPFSPRPICEVANAVYGPASFYSGSQSSNSYEIEVSFN